MSAIGIRHDPEADAEGEAVGGAGEAGSNGEGVGVPGVSSSPETAVGLGVAMNAASWGTAPQAAAAVQQIATNAAGFARMSFISNVGAGYQVSRRVS